MEKIKEVFWQGVTLLLVLVVPFALFMLCPRLLGWSEGWTFIVVIGYGAFLIGSVFWWLSRDEKILGEVENPILGKVTRRRSGWNARLYLPTTKPEEPEDYIMISGGEATGPTVMQISTFVEIKDGWGQWMAKLNQALDRHRDPLISARPREVVYDGVKMSANEFAWSLGFSLERDEVDLVLLANFSDGELIEVRLVSQD